MQILVTGGASALGQCLLRAIAARGALTRRDGAPATVRRLIAVDRAQALPLFVDERVEYVCGDTSQPRFLSRVMGTAIDSVFDLAGFGEFGAVDEIADFDAGLAASVDSLRVLIEACGFQSAPPRLVHAGTAAAFSAGSGDSAPASTAGVLGALCELLLAEYARRGLADARTLRLPWLIGGGPVEPLPGDVAGRLVHDALAGGVLCSPVELATPLWLGSMARAADALIRAHEVEQSAWGGARAVNAPGVATSVSELLDALREVVGEGALAAMKVEPDPALQAALRARPATLAVDRALALGFGAAGDAVSIVREAAKGSG